MAPPDETKKALDTCPVCGSVARPELRNPANPWHQLVAENKRLKEELEEKGRKDKWPT